MNKEKELEQTTELVLYKNCYSVEEKLILILTSPIQKILNSLIPPRVTNILKILLLKEKIK
jgi:hypothetical protein